MGTSYGHHDGAGIVRFKRMEIPTDLHGRRNLLIAFEAGFMRGVQANDSDACPRRYEANAPMHAAYRLGFETAKAAPSYTRDNANPEARA